MKVEQIDQTAIVMGEDQILTPSEILVKFELFGKIKQTNIRNIFEFNFEEKTCKLLVKNISYLGIPHPKNKKRIQLSLDQLHELRNPNLLLVGIYTYKDTSIYVVLSNVNFAFKQAKNTSIHINTYALQQASLNGYFYYKDKNDNYMQYYLYKYFKSLLISFTKISNNFSSLNSHNNFLKQFEKSIKGLNDDPKRIKLRRTDIKINIPVKSLKKREDNYIYFNGLKFEKIILGNNGLAFSGSIEELNRIILDSNNIYEALKISSFDQDSIFHYFKEKFPEYVHFNNDTQKKIIINTKEVIKNKIINCILSTDDRCADEITINEFLKSICSDLSISFQTPFIKSIFLPRILYGRPTYYFVKEDHKIMDPIRLGIGSFPNYIEHLVSKSQATSIFNIYFHIFEIAPYTKMSSFLRSLGKAIKSLKTRYEIKFDSGEFISQKISISNYPIILELAEAIKSSADTICSVAIENESPLCTYLSNINLLDFNSGQFRIANKVMDNNLYIRSEVRDESILLAFLFSYYNVQFEQPVFFKGLQYTYYYRNRFNQNFIQ